MFQRQQVAIRVSIFPISQSSTIKKWGTSSLTTALVITTRRRHAEPQQQLSFLRAAQVENSSSHPLVVRRLPIYKQTVPIKEETHFFFFMTHEKKVFRFFSPRPNRPQQAWKTHISNLKDHFRASLSFSSSHHNIPAARARGPPPCLHVLSSPPPGTSATPTTPLSLLSLHLAISRSSRVRGSAGRQGGVPSRTNLSVLL